MKKVLFVVSHVGSGSDAMCSILNQNPRVQWFRTERIYSHPDAAFALTENSHKLLTSAAIWMEDILFDASFCCPKLHSLCKFLYIIREPAQTLAQLILAGQTPTSAFHYYIFRLRRICQMATKTPGAVLMTWEDMVTRSGFHLVESYLNLKDALVLMEEWFPPTINTNKVPADLLERAEQSYNQHLYHLRQLPGLSQVKRSPLAALGGEDNAVGEEVPTGKGSITD